MDPNQRILEEPVRGNRVGFVLLLLQSPSLLFSMRVVVIIFASAVLAPLSMHTVIQSYTQ